MTPPRNVCAFLVALLLVVSGSRCSNPEVSKPAPGRGFNLLLVTIDTLRADRIGAYGYRAARTPNIDRLAADGVRFERAISSVPLTLPSHATILSGLLPQKHGLRRNGGGVFPDEADTLATSLARSGYRTAAFVGAFVLDHRFGLNRGFDLYDDEIGRDPVGGERLEAERIGSEVVDRALRWMEAGDARPFFGWVHLYDPHSPYTPPAPFAAGDPYDGEIAYADAQLGRLLGALAKLGVTDNTIVIVAGDHGEGLGEHGETTHGLLVYDSTLQVPFILHAPKLVPRHVVSTPVSLADLAPTAAGLLGIDSLSGVAGVEAGRDLSSAMRSAVEPAAADIYSESEYPATFGWSAVAAVRRGELKYIESSTGELFDLSSDPGEIRNVLTERRRDYRALDTRLEQLRAQPAAAPEQPLDAETRAKLASLGYVGSPPVVPSGKRPAPASMVGLFQDFEVASLSIAENRLDDAKKTLERLVTADPANAVFQSSLGRVLRQQKQYRRAIALYREAVAISPDDPEAWYNLAVTLQEAGKMKEASVAIREAVRRDPGRPEAHNTLGITMLSEGNLEAARGEFERAVAIDPRNPAAHNNLGNVMRSMDRLGEAEAAYQRAIGLAPRYADPLNGLGAIKVQQERPAEAIPLFDRALAFAPDNHEIRLNRAVALQLAGRPREAVAEYRAFIDRVRGDTQYAAQRRSAEEMVRGLMR